MRMAKSGRKANVKLAKKNEVRMARSNGKDNVKCEQLGQVRMIRSFFFRVLGCSFMVLGVPPCCLCSA